MFCLILLVQNLLKFQTILFKNKEKYINQITHI